MSDRFFFFLYRWFIWPLLRMTFGALALVNSKIARGLELRESVDGRSPWVKALPPTRPTVWFHCASGEFEYAKPVIHLLKAQVPAVKVVVTFFSPSYTEAIRKFAGVDWVVPLPWDSPKHLSNFLDSYRPSALLVARTDVWPEMARQTRLRGLKSVLFSATLTKNSGRTRGLGRWATRATLDQLDTILCVTDEDAETFRSLGLRHATIETSGDTRYDQVLARLESPKPLPDDIFASAKSGNQQDRDLFICGSTWMQDEDVLIPALGDLKESVCGIVVPHEPTPDHLMEIEKKLLASGLTPVRYSSANAAEQMKKPASCLIVDEVGILAELYLKARWAFVGGSFRKTVHSVMEPLAAGCVTFVGPLHTNNREAILFQTLPLSPNLGFVTVVESSKSLAKAIRELKSLPESKTQIQAAVRARTGSSQALVNWLASALS